MNSPSELSAERSTYQGLFLVTLTTLMYQVLLTRVFSVTMHYHFGFAAISIAMLGLTVGALSVYLLPRLFRIDWTHQAICLSAVAFAWGSLLGFWVHLYVPVEFEKPLNAFLSMTLIYLLLGVPFVCSGVCVTLILTRFPRHVSTLYAVDLVGAALGCLLVIFALEVMDAPSAAVGLSVLSAAGGFVFSRTLNSVWIKRCASLGSLYLVVFFLMQLVSVYFDRPVVRVVQSKGHEENEYLYDKWNAFSRVTVQQYIDIPFIWGTDVRNRSLSERVSQLWLGIDRNAASVITQFAGHLERLNYLKYDVTNVVHNIRRDARVLAVGVGGGRDILSALVFGQREVVGVEMNRNILEALNNRFGEYSGHLDRHPKVRFVNEEARSYVSRYPGTFDIIQFTLVDTWAATAAGAYVLTENSLYTVEAWQAFMGRLSKNGVMSVSRWKQEIHRLVSLAVATLKTMGVMNPGKHLLLIASPGGKVQTLLVGRAPFSAHDIQIVQMVAKHYGFKVALEPDSPPGDLRLAAIVAGDWDRLAGRDKEHDLSPPTDDRPFFFNMKRFSLTDFFSRSFWRNVTDVRDFNNQAVSVLASVFLAVLLLTILFVILPLALSSRARSAEGMVPYLFYFSSIGLGFMMVELSQMQRLIVFLGHPVYGLSVVLFSLLLSAGLGSFATRIIPSGREWYYGLKIFVALGIILFSFGVLTASGIEVFRNQPTAIRVGLSVLILAPIGFFMGMMFPLGMKLAYREEAEEFTPWFWGLNGATSVLASVLAVALAMIYGISLSYWVGTGAYGIAFLMFWIMSRHH